MRVFTFYSIDYCIVILFQLMMLLKRFILKESGLISEEADEILDYFEDNYKGRIDARSKHESGRRNPRFSVKSWNMYDSVLACSPRTNNAVEGWHIAFAKFVGVTHPSLFVLFEKFQIEQSNNEVVLEQILAGDIMPPQKKKYQDAQVRLVNCVSKYDEIGRIEYLRSIAHNVKMQSSKKTDSDN